MPATAPAPLALPPTTPVPTALPPTAPVPTALPPTAPTAHHGLNESVPVAGDDRFPSG